VSHRIPKPVGINWPAATAYERSLYRLIVGPILVRVGESFDALKALDDPLKHARARRQIAAIISAAMQDLDEVAFTSASRHVRLLAVWHRRRFLATFRAIGLDLERYMDEDAVRQALLRRVRTNVHYIRTIPQRLHRRLILQLEDVADSGRRFNPGTLRRILQSQYQVTGWNLRRLARDQTTKLLGQLTQIRQVQSGFTRYYWISAGDHRVRPEHAANDGQIFEWANPPPTGAPGDAVMCRCQASAVVEDSDIRLALRSFG